MANGYKAVWTNVALEELETTFDYLANNWTEKEIRKLAGKIENTVVMISRNPMLFQASGKERETRRAVIDKNNTLHYRIQKESIEIFSFFSNKKNPKSKSA